MQQLEAHLPRAFAFLREAKSVGGRCLVHCRKGISRSVAIVLAYLVAGEGFRLGDAWSLVQARRPTAQPNIGFARQLIDLDRAVHGPSSMPSLDFEEPALRREQREELGDDSSKLSVLAS
jgi:protein-tyrosine phosphatase